MPRENEVVGSKILVSTDARKSRRYSGGRKGLRIHFDMIGTSWVGDAASGEKRGPTPEGLETVAARLWKEARGS